MINFNFQETPLKNLIIIDCKSFNDERGSFVKLFSQNQLGDLINGKTIKQINKTFSHKEGTVRGIHFQNPPSSEIKIVSCLKGKVWDVAIDLRKGSKTFLNYHSEILSEDNNKSILIPEGFGHGFQTLTSDCEILYFHTDDYKKELEGIINAIDPMIGINWPLKITERSQRDQKQPMLSKKFRGFNF